MKCSIQIVWLLAVIIQGITLNAEEQHSAPPPPLTEKLVNQKAHAYLKKAVKAEEAFLQNCGSALGFQKMAEAMLNPSEKFTQVVNAINGYDKRTERVNALFEKHVVSQRLVQNRFQSAYKWLQAKLVEDTVALCVQHRVPEAVFGKKIMLWSLKETAFAGSYSALVDMGVRITRSDWFRTAASFVGSRVAADTTESVARQLGLWNHKEGGLMDSLLNSTLNFAAEAVIENVSRPSDQLAKTLKKNFDELTRIRLHDEHGFGAVCRDLVNYHIKLRSELLAGMKGGVK